MELDSLLRDEGAVSPVIGVILMVAITVILAAVIGAFVLGLGDEVQATTPTVQFGFDQDGEGADAEVFITHEGGDTVIMSQLSVVVDGEEPDAIFWNADQDTEITAGDSVQAGFDEGTDVTTDDPNEYQIVWESEDGSNTAVLGEYVAE